MYGYELAAELQRRSQGIFALGQGTLYPLLYSLESEIRARTYNLPLATYPLALQEAARLLDQGKNDDA